MVLQRNKESWLETGDGHSLYWAEYGDAEGDPLVLIHGGSGHVIDPEALDLDIPQTRLIIFHQRAVGKSLPLGETRLNAVQDNIEDIERLRTHLNIKKWTVLSWSFGTVFAAAYAMQYTGRCNGLLAYAPYLGSDEDYKVFLDSGSDAAIRYKNFHQSTTGKGIVCSVFNKAADPDLEMRFKGYVAASLVWDASQTEESIRNLRTQAEWKSFLDQRLVSARHDLELFCEKNRFLTCMSKQSLPHPPVTFVYGSEDNWAAPNPYSDLVFPQKKVIIIPGATHDIHYPAVKNTLRDALMKRSIISTQPV
jgi:proline iminopeptidase